MTRAEHLVWVKQRALLELDADPHGAGPTNAVTSVQSDLRKHPDTAGHPAIVQGTVALVIGVLRTADEVRRWIEKLS